MSQTLTLRDWPDDWVTLACHDCDRKGRYRKETLIEQFGADAELPELRHQIAQCPLGMRSQARVVSITRI